MEEDDDDDDVELHVTVSNTKILSVAQQCPYGKYTLLATIEHT
jgi:hypothetical protein